MVALSLIALAAGAPAASASLSGAERSRDGQLRERLAAGKDGTIAYVNSDADRIVLTLVGRDGQQKDVTWGAHDVLEKWVAISDARVVTVAWQTQVGQGDVGGVYTRTYTTSGTLLASTTRVLPPKGVLRSRFYLNSIAAGGGGRTVLVTNDATQAWATVRTGSRPFTVHHRTGYTEAAQVLTDGTVMLASYSGRLSTLRAGSRTWRTRSSRGIRGNPSFSRADDGGWAYGGWTPGGGPVDSSTEFASRLLSAGGTRVSTFLTPEDGDFRIPEDAFAVALPDGGGALVFGSHPGRRDFPTELRIGVALRGLPTRMRIIPGNPYAGEPYEAESSSTGTIAVLTRFTDLVIRLAVLQPDGRYTTENIGVEAIRDETDHARRFMLLRAAGRIVLVEAYDEYGKTGGVLKLRTVA
jgi:hypothetical protein